MTNKERIEYAGKKFDILDGVYVPSDDTFMLAETLKVRKGERVLDMCAGSGILGILASDAAGSVTLVDDDELAVKNIKINLGLNKVKNAKVICSSLFQKVKGKFDLLIFNPPFLPQEHGEDLYLYDDKFEKWRNIGWHAWDGGADGRKVIDRFLKTFDAHLADGGRVHMIGSSLSNYKKTARIFRGKGMKVKILARKRFFFEELVVMEARMV